MFVEMLKDIIAVLFLAGGLFFMLAGAIGFLRFPDFFTRLHATGKCDTLGEVLIVVGLILYAGLSPLSAKLIFLSFFILLANPSGTHAMMRAAYVTGIKPWKRGEERR